MFSFFQQKLCNCACYLVVGMIVVVASGKAKATNISFMPGDAFFHAELTEIFVEKLSEKSDSIKFGYSEPSWMGLGDFGSYAGFPFLRLEGTNASMIVNLRKAYRHARSYYDHKKVEIYIDKHGKHEEQEINPLHLFVYNRNVDWKNQRITQKYNEDWPNWPVEAIAEKKDLLPLGPTNEYHPFIKTYEAVVEDRQYAKWFDPLKVSVPRGIKWAMLVVPPIKEPVVAQAKDIQIIILPENKLKDYYHRKPKHEFYQLTGESFKLLAWNEDGEIIEKDFSVVEKDRYPPQDDK